MNNSLPIMGGILGALIFSATAIYNSVWGYLVPAALCAGVAVYFLVTKTKV